MKVLSLFAGLVWSCLALMSANGQTCKPLDRLQAVQQSYEITENRAMLGLLGACPPIGEQLAETLRYQILDEEDVPSITLINAETGEFKFEPPPNWYGVLTFAYRVSDGHDHGASAPAKVTVLVRGHAGSPLLELNNVGAVGGSYVPLDMKLHEIDDGHATGRVMATVCNCDEQLTCSSESGTCSCRLSLPEGWVLAEGLQHRLLDHELLALTPAQLQSLTLKTQVNSSGHHCLDVHVVDWPAESGQPLTSKYHLHIDIDPGTATAPAPEPDRPAVSGSREAVQLETREGRPVRFGALHVRDSDADKGVYRVQVSVDRGGTLWLNQAHSQDVIFHPKERHDQEWERPDQDKEYRQHDRFGNFYDTYRSHDTQSSNNGKGELEFVGSLDGINDVLKEMVYVPWCPKWPTPPNWDLPAGSWMESPIYDDAEVDEDPMKPNIWPQWYPRFWYPFPRKHWSWWPRVLPPWWLNQTCSDWTSRVHLEVREITPRTCGRDEDRSVVDWYADVHVAARGSEPKSLVADNLFNYFPPTAESFVLSHLYLRSKEESFRLRFSLNVLEDHVTILNTDTGTSSFTCTNSSECDDQLQKIQVQLDEEAMEVCKVTIEIRMYRDDSTYMSDYMMVWGYRTSPECIPRNAITIEPPRHNITALQGETIELELRSQTALQSNRDGILHTVIYAEQGLVTVSAPDGLRVYMDHMGHHERIPTYLCISGPADMVVEALASAKLILLKSFKGHTSVKIDYGVPFRALQKTYNSNMRPPLTRVTVGISVLSSEPHPSLPMLVMPSKVCMSEMDLLALDMIRLSGMDTEDARFNMSLQALRGRLHVETSRIAEIYDCPEQTGADGMAQDGADLCTEECSFHTACPGNQMCCLRGCDRVCMEPQQVATISSSDAKGISIEGKISTINNVLEAENLWYMANQCQSDDVEEATKYQEDAIRIDVKQPGRMGGDFSTLFVNVSCRSPVGAEEASSIVVSNCEENWGPWRECKFLAGACGRGTQVRVGRCGSELRREERPCQTCGCQPARKTLVAPGCSSVYPVLRCPQGCTADAYHLERRDFLCDGSLLAVGSPALPAQSPDTGTQKSKVVDVHDTCVCDACRAEP